MVQGDQPDRDAQRNDEREDQTLELTQTTSLLTPGQVLGNRYQIRELLGRGGIGEVWHAYDVKLRVEVALKALRADFFQDEYRRKTLRQEVRAAREVVSPNVCRIFDLTEVDNTELVSMEFIDGNTLLEVLQERGPLDLKEAQDIASQFLAGLDAIHRAGLVHRDIKPENIMITRSGRVVVMDFGLARREDEGGGTVAGTPAYMAPEQAAGQAVDARADVYSAGVVLAEMVSPDGIKSSESRQSVWQGIRSDPVQVPETPWAPVLRKAVARDPDHRFRTAHTLTRSLEEMTLRSEGAEELHPYPGLASFTEQDAEYFFGREAEVEQLWHKLDRPHLLALVGPSGAGKTSFLRAGLIPTADAGWGILRCTPGNTPFVSLGRVFAREMAGDADAVELLVRADDPEALCQVARRWRQRHDHALLIVDQFEELFTQCTTEEQARFADLMGQLALTADIFVLLSMRDDFLIRCRAHEALAPIFSDLTAVLPPTGAALRRAMVQPATICGYRFEDDTLVDEMLAEVEGERGALPLLAFAMSRLWEKRDRENGLLTRQAYHEIGGVGGALARHAEATLTHIGAERAVVVRELFRNLVTADRTRAVRSVDEALSVFPTGERETAREVLRELIDARLLTTYEVENEGETPQRRVEIIHESLLEKWPRLQGWQTQDADAARLRDELRQAAAGWDEHGRSVDRLWTGSAYREFALWRERYPGGLTETEQAFAAAMTSFATRRRRRRRLAVAAAFLVVVAVAAALGTMWQRSMRESHRAEAQKLVAMGRAELDNYPTASLAYARASLELHDTAEARHLIVEALWRGAAERLLDTKGTGNAHRPDFSPDGRLLVVSDPAGQLIVYNQQGEPPITVEAVPGDPLYATFAAQGKLLAVRSGDAKTISTVSVSDWQTLCTFEMESPVFYVMGEDEVLALQRIPGELKGTFTSYPLDCSAPHPYEVKVPIGQGFAFNSASRQFATCSDRQLVIRSLDPEMGGERVIGHHDDRVELIWWPARRSDRIVTRDRSQHFHVWSLERGLECVLMAPEDAKDANIIGDDGGRWLALGTPYGPFYLWDLDGPPGAKPRRIIARSEGEVGLQATIDPVGRWLVTPREGVISFCPLQWPPVHVIPFSEGHVWWPEFTPDGQRLLVRTRRQLALLPLAPGLGEPSLIDLGGSGYQLGISPDGRYVATTVQRPSGNSVVLVPLAGSTLGEPEELLPQSGVWRWSARFDPTGRYLATATWTSNAPEKQRLEIIDLQTRQIMAYPLTDARDPEDIWSSEGGVCTLCFDHDGSLLTCGNGGIYRWDIHTGEHELIYADANCCDGPVSMENRSLFVYSYESQDWKFSDPKLLDLDSGTVRPLDVFGGNVALLDATGTKAVSLGNDKVVRVGLTSGGEPHLLCGHAGEVKRLNISPDSRWIASATDAEIRIWPMPDASRPPLHTLPHAELLAKLDTYTNLRAVRDVESPSGWKLEIGPFPGWETAPTW
jgi:WD40 repeat protein